MLNIIVIECRSTGKLFIEDIINRGYNPVVLHLKNDDTEEGKDYEKSILNQYKTIPFEFDMVYEQDSFEETLAEVKKFDPLLIIPGSIPWHSLTNDQYTNCISNSKSVNLHFVNL